MPGIYMGLVCTFPQDTWLAQIRFDLFLTPLAMSGLSRMNLWRGFLKKQSWVLEPCPMLTRKGVFYILRV